MEYLLKSQPLTKIFIILIIICQILLSKQVSSQTFIDDTLKITVENAEKKFLEQNLQLLEGKCNIDAARAQIIQAGLWHNPTLSLEQNVYNFETHKAIDITPSGNTVVSFEQLFELAGKRNKQIQIEKINTAKEETIFYDLIRTLRFELRTDFYSLNSLLKSLLVYDIEIGSMNKTIAGCEEQYKNGFISLKELVRLRASLFSLENEKQDLQQQVIEKESELRLLMKDHHKFIMPLIDQTPYKNLNPEKTRLEVLLDSAFKNRYDLRQAELSVDASKANLAYQKAISIPDLTAGLILWDRSGSYVNNYNALTIQMDLPFFNRNQGNIRTAKSQVESSGFSLETYRETVRNEVLTAYSKAIQNDHLYHSYEQDFGQDLQKILNEVIKNYSERNISMLEFLDYYDSYKETMLQKYTLENNRISAIEEVNFSVGKPIFEN
jgi:outer membrane protein, heavy metal efflux system